MASSEIVSKDISEKFSARVASGLDFITKLEGELFNPDSFPKLGRKEKMELYSLAKSSLMEDINFMLKVYATNKDVDRETMMLLGIINSMPMELRPVIASKLKEIVIHKEKYIKEFEDKQGGKDA